MSVYEVHLGSWRRGRSYRDLAEELTAYVADRGFTHVELMPVAEHPYGGSWGYQVTSYFAPTARFGSPDDFRYLVDRLHQAGIGVLMDWVPGHFPKDDWALASFDGSSQYEHPDPRRGEQPDWGTYVFDFGRHEVRNFLVANAIYWLEEFHIDGLRVDAVASMLYLDYSRPAGSWMPNVYGGRENLEAISFLQEVNATAYKRVPGIVMIAEESTAWPGVTKPTHLGGLGFGLKWNMGWMNDSLSYMSHNPIHRQYHHHQMTFSLMYAYSENFLLPLSHDEVVHGKGSLLRKMPGDRWKQLANLRAFLALMWAHPGKQLLFMGSEFGQEAEWAESHELDWWLLDHPEHAGLQRLVTDINRIYRESTALWTQDSDPAGFEWIDANDAAGNVFSFLRWGSDGSVLACIANFSALPHEGYRVGLPRSRPVDRDRQHRRHRLRRFGSRQPRRRRDRGCHLAWPPRIGRAPSAAVGHAVAAARARGGLDHLRPGRPGRLEERAGQGGACFRDAWVSRADQVEQLEEPRSDLVAVVAAHAPDSVDQPGKRIVDLPVGHLEIGRGELGADIGGISVCRATG